MEPSPSEKVDAMTKPEPRQSVYTSNGNGNKSWWYILLRDFGTPTAAAVVLGWVVWVFLLIPSRDHTEKLIQANIETQQSLTETTSNLSKSIQGINESIHGLSTTVNEQSRFMQQVNEVHGQQLAAIKNNGNCNQENAACLKEISETMKRAETMMSEVPAERTKQTKLLEEIRDKLPN